MSSVTPYTGQNSRSRSNSFKCHIDNFYVIQNEMQNYIRNWDFVLHHILAHENSKTSTQDKLMMTHVDLRRSSEHKIRLQYTVLILVMLHLIVLTIHT